MSRAAAAAIRAARAVRGPKGERCPLCASPLPPQHEHLLDLGSQAQPHRELSCACQGCALVLADVGVRWRRLPDRGERLEIALDPSDWARLGVPVDLAFVVVQADGGVEATYPSRAGALRSTLPLDAWPSLVARHPVLATLRPEVEGLLVHRTAEAGPGLTCWRLPLDRCYAVIGHLRSMQRLSLGPDIQTDVAAWVEHLALPCADLPCGDLP